MVRASRAQLLEVISIKQDKRGTGGRAPPSGEKGRRGGEFAALIIMAGRRSLTPLEERMLIAVTRKIEPSMTTSAGTERNAQNRA